LKNDYVELKKEYAPKPVKNMTKHPLFGYVVVCLILAIMQILWPTPPEC